ncbi:unnamed protein product [Rangifer tarandus platyrhynchus]|uniref:Uncharacterized protein n=1 Tax=Rangifer tarandus platyrhynchus TaxID=3082113 RepID=A0AC60A004_RANTA
MGNKRFASWNGCCRVGLFSPLLSSLPKAATQQEAREMCFPIRQASCGSALLQVAMLTSGSERRNEVF